jgi:hypothetical protein
VIWPGFDSIALLIPATLQRNMLYAAQASSSCSFDRHFLKYASAVQNAQADNGCIHFMHYLHYMHYSHYLDNAAPAACPPVGQGTLVLPE